MKYLINIRQSLPGNIASAFRRAYIATVHTGLIIIAGWLLVKYTLRNLAQIERITNYFKSPSYNAGKIFQQRSALTNCTAHSPRSVLIKIIFPADISRSFSQRGNILLYRRQRLIQS